MFNMFDYSYNELCLVLFRSSSFKNYGVKERLLNYSLGINYEVENLN